MQLRLICREDDAVKAANVGGAVQTRHLTFDCEAPPMLVEWLSEKRSEYVERLIVAVEVLD